MASPLSSDKEFTETAYVVIDFETTTPAGHRPEPIEVAALALRPDGARMAEVFRHEALICPPAHAPVTAFDTRQTCITPQMVAGQPAAATALAVLDARLVNPPYRLVAHHAPTEAGIIYDHRSSCPHLAAAPLLDTVRLARAFYPDLPSHSLDALLDYLNISRPAGRHRAMPDAEVTAALFTKLIHSGFTTGRWRTLHDLSAIAGVAAKAGQPLQEALF